MNGWYIDYINKDNKLVSVFMPGSSDTWFDYDNGLASARSCLFIFDVNHRSDFKTFVGIKRGVCTNV